MELFHFDSVFDDACNEQGLFYGHKVIALLPSMGNDISEAVEGREIAAAVRQLKVASQAGRLVLWKYVALKSDLRHMTFILASHRTIGERT